MTSPQPSLQRLLPKQHDLLMLQRLKLPKRLRRLLQRLPSLNLEMRQMLMRPRPRLLLLHCQQKHQNRLLLLRLLRLPRLAMNH